jgi:hypothetical protein
LACDPPRIPEVEQNFHIITNGPKQFPDLSPKAIHDDELSV